MFRLIIMTFFGNPRYDQETAKKIHESPKVMTLPLIALAVLSVVGGFIGWPELLGGGAWFEHFLHPVFERGIEVAQFGEAHHYSHMVEYVLILASIAVVVLMILTARRFYLNKDETYAMEQKLGGVHTLLYNKYWVDEFYDKAIVQPLINFSMFLWQFFDVKVIDGIVNGSAWVVGAVSGGIRRAQTGIIRSYAFVFLIGAVFVIGYLILNR